MVTELKNELAHYQLHGQTVCAVRNRCCQHEPSEVKLQEQQHPLIVYLKPPKLQFGDLVISHEKSVFIHSEARAGRW